MDGGVKMKKLLVFCILSLSVFIVQAHAQNNDSEEYLIKKGDTLWSISNSELEDTFLWPKLWSVNPHIANPDLIYPGSRIRIPSREELMGMPPVPMRPAPPVVKKEKKPKAIIAPQKAVQKYIIDRNLFIASGWIDDKFPGIGEIIYAPGDRRVIAKGDTAYLKFADKEYGSNNQFYIIRDIKIVRHPVTDNQLGHQIRVAGILKVIGAEKDMPKAIITASFEDINVGDGLLPYRDLEPPLIPDNARTPDINGHIVESHRNSVLSDEGSIIFLDKGEKDGVQTGDIYSVFSDLPTESPIGKIQIVLLQPTTSNAVILESSNEILIGAKWGQKK